MKTNIFKGFCKWIISTSPEKMEVLTVLPTCPLGSLSVETESLENLFCFGCCFRVCCNAAAPDLNPIWMTKPDIRPKGARRSTTWNSAKRAQPRQNKRRRFGAAELQKGTLVPYQSAYSFSKKADSHIYLTTFSPKFQMRASSK